MLLATVSCGRPGAWTAGVQDGIVINPALRNPSSHTAVSSSETERHAHQAALATQIIIITLTTGTVRRGLTLTGSARGSIEYLEDLGFRRAEVSGPGQHED